MIIYRRLRLLFVRKDTYINETNTTAFCRTLLCMKTQLITASTMFVLFAIASCTNKQTQTRSDAPEAANETVDTIAEQTEPTDTADLFPQLDETVIYTYTCTDGHKREFIDQFVKYDADHSSPHDLIADDGELPDDRHFVQLLYPRYKGDPDYYSFIGGCPRPFYSLPSKDGKTLYVVTGVQANSNGWTTEYQLFKIDCETLKAEFLCECAGIAATKTGFTVCQARLTNGETAKCNADMYYAMHDEQLDWSGKVTAVSKKEYDYQSMDDKYLTAEDTYIKGFNPLSIEY